MKNDLKLLEEAYNRIIINEYFVLDDYGIKAILNIARHCLGSGASSTELKVFSSILLLLVSIGPVALMAFILSGPKKIISDATHTIWAKIRGNLSLNSDEVEHTVETAKALLTGPDKGRLTRLTNEMKQYIQQNEMGKAQEVADQIKDLIK